MTTTTKRRIRLIEPAMTVGILLNGVRLRRRLAAVPRLPVHIDDEPVAIGHRFVTAAGVELDEVTRRAASRYATEQGLEAVDLVPGDLPVERMLDLARALDATTFRTDPFAEARGGGHAFLVTDDLAERAQLDATSHLTADEFADLTRTIKRFAPRRTDVAIAHSFKAIVGERRAEVIRANVKGGSPYVAIGIAAQLGLLIRGVVARRPWGIAAFVAYSGQPLIAVAATDLRPRDLKSRVGARVVGATKDVLQLGLRGAAKADEKHTRELRERYQDDLELGIERFFEPRRTDCPLCGSVLLHRHTDAIDYLQCKPGVFAVDVCEDCGHLFQNPRLTIDGLDFYYRDFYDGEGAEAMDGVFSSGSWVYEQRARLVEALGPPDRWLDVGTGHGHFCLAARSVYPEATFDGLDMSDSIDEALRTGWIDHGHRGLFPELAPDIEEPYDVVSMFHYLEHTRDPVAEIAAARQALAVGGLLVIEVPNPESRFGRALGKWWGPLMQPQHLNLVSMGNLVRILGDNGFEPVVRRGADAHQPCDLVFGTYLALNRVAPPLDLPWRPESTMKDRLRHKALWWTIGIPAMPVALVLDQVIAPVLKRTDSHSAYQVVARRVS